MNQNDTYGILGQFAPKCEIKDWINEEGQFDNSVQIENYKGKVVVLFCFQDWCQGCHSIGFPALQRMTDALGRNEEIVFLAIQTVFEGHSVNTFDKLVENQKKYQLKIPFGQDNGDTTTQGVSKIMHQYRTGGTPWFIVINQDGIVIFNDFHINTKKAIAILETLN
ncbi:redoxin domain-containing protein [Flavobacterium sp. NG2]|uniref:peroxiredoxin family protein n=1 Tax=Flavobacterium sp. NG2 TaxID=3097547 RepID=UPI002A8402BC|nr:redoxin domain-containing protein [Flavobacterium sp. NG2]WPR70670.1 redoxin domain-containing protein [Flavobacterium sp. NG2]